MINTTAIEVAIVKIEEAREKELSFYDDEMTNAMGALSDCRADIPTLIREHEQLRSVLINLTTTNYANRDSAVDLWIKSTPDHIRQAYLPWINAQLVERYKSRHAPCLTFESAVRDYGILELKQFIATRRL